MFICPYEGCRKSIFQHPFHYKIKARKKNDALDNIRSKLIQIENDIFSALQSSVDYKNFNVTLKKTVKALHSLKEMNLQIFADIKENNTKFEKIKIGLDKSIDEKIQGFESQKFLVTYLQKFYQNRAVIGNFQSKKSDRKQAFHERYIKPILEPQPSKNSSPLLLCRFCRQNYVIPQSFSVKDNDTIFSETMFSTIAVSMETFPNFFFNMQSDLFICKICLLLMLCVWAGITEIPWQLRERVTKTQYIFVNLPSIQLLVNENDLIHNLYDVFTKAKATDAVHYVWYEEVIKDIFEKSRDLKMKGQWVLDNIMFVELRTTGRKDIRGNDFRYFHIGKDISRLILDKYASKALEKISRVNVKVKSNLTVRLKSYVISRLLAHEPLLDICHALIHDYLTMQKHKAAIDYSVLRNIFSILAISSIRTTMSASGANNSDASDTPSINNTNLSSKQVYGILANLRKEGSMFARDLDIKTRRQKAYRLDTKARSNMVEDFYHDLIKLYLSVDKSPPPSLVGILNRHDVIPFESKALAFLTGFLAEPPAGESTVPSNTELAV